MSYDIIISSHGATTWTAHYNTCPQKLFRLVRHCYCRNFVYIFISIAPLFGAYYACYARRLYLNFDEVLVQRYCRQQNGTRPDDNDRHRCHHRRSGPVVTRQSVGVGLLYAFRSPQSMRNTRHAFSFVPRRRITLFPDTLSLSLSYTLSPLFISLILTFFLLRSILGTRPYVSFHFVSKNIIVLSIRLYFFFIKVLSV